tara:strand:+ start:43 stop:408 length:366 start_codon:yes stop_codon:yes gene_type:complete
MQKMEEEGIVLGKQVLFDRNSLGLKIVVFLSITVGRHSTDWVEKFTAVIEKFPEIVEVHRLTGEGADYQLKVVCPSIELYDLFQQNLISKIDFTSMSTKMSLKQLKDTSLLPLSHLETLSD